MESFPIMAAMHYSLWYVKNVRLGQFSKKYLYVKIVYGSESCWAHISIIASSSYSFE